MHVGDLPVGETLSSSHEYSSGSLKSIPLQVLRNWTRRSMLRIRTLAGRTITDGFWARGEGNVTGASIIYVGRVGGGTSGRARRGEAGCGGLLIMSK